MAAVTIKDVAARAGVSVGTVSHVFNHPDRVSAASRAKVERAVADLHFVRNTQAGELRRGRASTIGMVVLDIANPFFAEAAVAVEDTLSDAGLLMTLSSSRSDVDHEAQLLESLKAAKVRGILLTPCSEDVALAESIAGDGIPVVLMDAQTDSPLLSSVAVDDEHGAYLAIQHLVEAGRRRVVFLNGPHAIRQARSRSRGAARAWEDAGRDPADLVEIECDAFRAPDAQREATKVLAKGMIDAFFCGNDLMAMGAYNALRAARLRIPEDVAVVGFDDTPMAAQFATPLTTVRQPLRELGSAAAALLLREDAPVEHVSLPPRLVVRESTAGEAATTRA
ncbi:MAG: LacI family DNA-binding transcriptional regulator [Actinomycetaceae bacterium]|nr:LacI family DNA-binding transcriptional regulator [Actinomycetaceae bacterium]MDU0969921.1 LacI family DNA-binding transcriptional regulator [Actinomycetaceae bacterium]